MNLRNRLCLLLLLWLFSLASFGQMEEYDYKRELKDRTAPWHKIILPDDLFGKIKPDLSDIRIFGITSAHDTVEAPFLLQVTQEKISAREVSVRILNMSHNEKGYYFTFEIPGAEQVNQIKPLFKQANFDWRLKLEGSQDLKEWFTILDDYRILSIKNELTDFQFTKITFPDARYRFFRMLVVSKEKPELTDVKILEYGSVEGHFRNYAVHNMTIHEQKEKRETEIAIDLHVPVPVSHIKIFVRDTFDFYRPVMIEYLSDSVRTEQGWKYSYNTLTSGLLNSLEENDFKFNSTIVQKLKVIVANGDNQPLHIDSITAKGYVHELTVRFTEKADYFLAYGNSRAIRPQYDLDKFIDKIPESVSILQTGAEEKIDKEPVSVIEPLFKNKIWLWAIMSLIIILLGWFTIKMMNKK